MSVRPPAQPVQNSSDERSWGIFCHLAALAAITNIPFAHILGPLIVWLVKKEQYPFVNDQGKEALNFQISMTIYCIVLLLLAIPLMICSVIRNAPYVLIIFPIAPVIVLTDLILVITAAIAASNGRAYRYPITIRFIK